MHHKLFFGFPQPQITQDQFEWVFLWEYFFFRRKRSVIYSILLTLLFSDFNNYLYLYFALKVDSSKKRCMVGGSSITNCSNLQPRSQMFSNYIRPNQDHNFTLLSIKIAELKMKFFKYRVYFSRKIQSKNKKFRPFTIFVELPTLWKNMISRKTR